MIGRRKVKVLLTTVMTLASVGSSFAGMGDPGGGCGWNTGAAMMTNHGGFGMMNGAAGGPVVGSDGTAYIVSMASTSTPGTRPTWMSFRSHLLAIPQSGPLLDLTLDGLVSKPVVSGGALIATTSLPNQANYHVEANQGTTAAESVLFFLPLPLSTSSVPQAILMDGRYASMPVIADNQIYVTTTTFGYGMMMGNDVFNSTFPSPTGGSNAHAYLYVFTMDGALVSKTVLQ